MIIILIVMVITIIIVVILIIIIIIVIIIIITGTGPVQAFSFASFVASAAALPLTQLLSAVSFALKRLPSQLLLKPHFLLLASPPLAATLGMASWAEGAKRSFHASSLMSCGAKHKTGR